MLFPSPSEFNGSTTPQLEGAPRSQSHAVRVIAASAPLLPDSSSSPQEKGAEHEATSNASV